MRLSIITINFNNRDGLKKTIESVVAQTFRDFEWIVIDGGSTDGSKELLEQYSSHFSYWVSEPDKGIYNAMNKGIKVSKGEYCFFLNSGDSLFDKQVLDNVFSCNTHEDIIVGNYYRSTGELLNSIGELWNGVKEEITLFTLFDYTIQHSGCAFMKRSLFDEYGLYDEALKICSDWKWFLQTVGFGNVSLEKIEIPISIYDVNGVSSILVEERKKERNIVMKEMIPPRIVLDYENYNELRKVSLEEQRKIRSSWPYKIGQIVTCPIKRMYKILHK